MLYSEAVRAPEVDRQSSVDDDDDDDFGARTDVPLLLWLEGDEAVFASSLHRVVWKIAAVKNSIAVAQERHSMLLEWSRSGLFESLNGEAKPITNDRERELASTVIFESAKNRDALLQLLFNLISRINHAITTITSTLPARK